MAVKQNGVLATFTPTTSKYTNQTVAAPGTVAATAWNMYTCPQSTLMSGKLIVSNNTGGALNIDVGIVEQTDVIQLDALSAQPGSPSGYGAFSFPSGTSSNHATSIVLDYANWNNTNFNSGETLSWTNSNRSPAAQTAIIHYWDQANNELWLRDMSHPLGLDAPSGDTNFTSSGGGTCSAGTSYAGTGGTAGWSGNLRFYDSLNGTLYLQNREFRNNLDYAYLYDNDTNENREQSNNNLNRSLGRVWRPVATTQQRYAAVNSTPATEFISSNGIKCLISAVTQVSAEQFIVNDKSLNDNEIFELNGIVLGSYQSLYVKSTGAVTFTLIGFEEVAQSLS
tara:strand:- start:557 stop:1570 length:1014 start_codon:yes stop_codon:yes gene_type:complete